jgi:hypothetical protein
MVFSQSGTFSRTGDALLGASETKQGHCIPAVRRLIKTHAHQKVVLRKL